MYGTFKVVRRDKERVTVCGGGGGECCDRHYVQYKETNIDCCHSFKAVSAP